MSDGEKRRITAIYERDTKRYHRFLIDEGQGITGSLYIPKSEKVPEIVEIVLQIKGAEPEAGK